MSSTNHLFSTRKTYINPKEVKIIQSALNVFSTYGFQGASIEQIANETGISKSNLFYYFSSKEELYIEVLSQVLEEWLKPLKDFTLEQQPAEAIGNYIDVKFLLSKKKPEASRLYAFEMMQGAPYLLPLLKGPLKKLVKEKTEIIDLWIEKGQLKPVSALHLIFHIWAVSQHYSDFAVQCQAITGKTLTNKVFYQDALTTCRQLILESLIPDEHKALLTENPDQ